MRHGFYRLAVLVALMAITASATAQTVFVDEDFESYGSQGALNSSWVPLAGDGFSSAPAAGGELVLAADGVANQTGNAAAGAKGVINEESGGWDPVTNSTGYLISPSVTESIVMRGDIFIDAEFGSTMRQTIGLRSDRFDRDPTSATAFGVNFVEMGTWNGSVCLPTAPDCDPGDPAAEPPIPGDENYRVENDFAYRITVFDSTTRGNFFENGVDLGPLLATPNWQYFPLKAELDDVTNEKPNGTFGDGDGVANLADIGTGWHTFEAIISEDAVTMTLDLFRDGIDNATGLAGPDATVVTEIAMSQNFNDAPFDYDPSPMNSFRYGSPSGVTSDPGVAHFDNLYLALEDAIIEPETLVGDFNGDSIVDAADYTVWRDTLGDSVTAGTGADANGNGVIDGPLSGAGNDYELWAGNYGATAAAATAVPEPAALLMAGWVACLAAARRR